MTLHAMLRTGMVLGAATHLVVGCMDPPLTFIESDVRPFVTDALLPHVDGAGHFAIPNILPVSEHAIVPEGDAKAIALAFVTTFGYPDISIGAPFAEYWEKERGARIDWRTLHVTGAVIAESPYEDVPLGTHVAIRNLGGPAWIIRLGDRIGPALSTKVGLYATGFSIVNGELRMPPVSGNDLSAYGNDMSSASLAFPIGPERAAIRAARATGALVAAVPALVLPERMYHYTFARWRIELDRDIAFQVIGSTATRVSRTVYVGVDVSTIGPAVKHDGLYLAATAQYDADTVRIESPVILKRKAGMPLHYERVMVAP